MLQKPTTSANATNQLSELDLTEDANWTDVRAVRFALKQRRASEINTVDQTEGVRLVRVEMHGDSITRQMPSRWRITYNDQDGAVHRLNITGVIVSDDGTWVTADCEEAV